MSSPVTSHDALMSPSHNPVTAVMGFSRDEWVAAQSLVMPRAEAEEAVDEFFAYIADLAAKAERGELSEADEQRIDLGFDIETFVRFAQLGGDVEVRAKAVVRDWLAQLGDREREVLLSDRPHLARFWP